MPQDVCRYIGSREIAVAAPFLARSPAIADDTLITLLNQRIRNIPGVLSTETFVYLKLHKQHYNWGTR